METKTENVDFTCSRYFGYLSQLSGGKEAPDECLTCKKLLECKYTKSDTGTQRKASKTAVIEEVKQSIEGPVVDTAKKDLEKTKHEDKTKTSPVDFPKYQFMVENLGKYELWTVFIDKETFSGWGGRITDVDVQTKAGKKMRCKVMPSKGSRKGIILVPEKIQLKLEIKQGELVSVEPSILLMPENKTRDIVQTLYKFQKNWREIIKTTQTRFY